MAQRVQPFAWNPNIGAVNGFGIRLPGISYSVNLAAATDTELLIPSLPSSGRTQTAKNAGYAIIKYENDAECWVAIGDDAVPTPSLTTSFVGIESMLNPECILVYEGDILHFYSTPTCVVSVTIFPWA